MGKIVRSAGRWRAIRDGFAAAWMLLLALPLPRVLWGERVRIADALWAFPLVGAVVGALAGGVFLAGMVLGLPQELAIVAALATSIWVTGGLHEDGLADVADGFGGGRDVAHKLAIMRDSRVGSFAVLALGLALAARGLALMALAPSQVFLALVATHLLARAVLAVPIYLFATVRDDGLSGALGRPGLRSMLLPLVLALLATLLMLPPIAALTVTGMGLAGALAVALLAQRQIGGLTGDVLGAAEQVAEIGVLWGLVLLLAVPGG